MRLPEPESSGSEKARLDSIRPGEVALHAHDTYKQYPLSSFSLPPGEGPARARILARSDARRLASLRVSVLYDFTMSLKKGWAMASLAEILSLGS